MPPDTSIPTITVEQFAQRLLKNFPRDWASDEARAPGGVLYALAYSTATQLARTQTNLVYILKASRIDTAVEEALDRVASDFFAVTEVRRRSGESDTSLRSRIKASLLLEYATRKSIKELIKRLTGEEPRIVEPWNGADTGAWDARSYNGIDMPGYSCRIGDTGLRYQGFVESILPSFGHGPHPVYGLDAGAAWDVWSGALLEPASSWFLGEKQLDALINKIKPYGTIVWRQYRSNPLSNWPLGGFKNFADGVDTAEVTIYPPFAGYFVVLAVANWNTAVTTIPLSNNKFKISCQTSAPPGGGRVDWVASPITIPGWANTLVLADSASVSIGIPATLPNHNLLVTPNGWNTSVWLSAADSVSRTISFSTPPYEQTYLSCGYFPPDKSGVVPVQTDTIQTIVNISTRDPFEAFVLPTWNTTVTVEKTPTSITVTYGTPPVDQQKLYWGIFES